LAVTIALITLVAQRSEFGYGETESFLAN